MNIKNQKKLVAKIFKIGKKRIKLDPARAQDIKEAITRADVRALIIDKFIKTNQKKGISYFHVRKIRAQKRRGRRKGPGSKKGTSTSKLSRKKIWINKIRVQRNFLKSLKQNKLLSTKDFRVIYRKAKGGFFRSARHLKLYLEENNLLKPK